MSEPLKLISALFNLEPSDRRSLINVARKDASDKQGRLKLWAKWSLVYVSVLVLSAFLAGVGIALLFDIFRSDSPAPTAVAVTIGIGFSMFWPYAQTLMSVFLLGPEIRARLDCPSVWRDQPHG